MPLYHCLADEQLAMHKPNLFIVVTVKFNIDVWLLLMQPGWAVVWRTNCQGCPLCYSDVLPWIAMDRGGASAVRGLGLGAFLRCDLIVDPVKLPSCLEDASVTQVRVKWHRGERLDFQMRWWIHYRNTASHRKRNSMDGMEARSAKLHQTLSFLFSSLRFQFCGFRQTSCHLVNRHSLLYCFHVTYMNLTIYKFKWGEALHVHRRQKMP